MEKVGDSSINSSAETIKQMVEAGIAEINTTKAALQGSIPLSWNKVEFSALNGSLNWLLFFVSKLVGLTVTVFAIMMGAPFWFDVLNKIANLRGAGKKPDDGSSK